jgi:DNA repair exonuclease SbcCD ATPase subunit
MIQEGEPIMAIDDVPQQEVLGMKPAEDSGANLKFGLIFVILAVLVIGEIYALARISSVRASLEAEQAAMQRALSTQLDQRFSNQIKALQNAHAQQLEVLRQELEATSQRMGSTGKELRRARTMVNQLQAEQRQQADKLKAELAGKADQQQVGALSQDVSATRTDLDNTKKILDATRADLGMARSELGTLIARNHDDIETLRKMGERDYFEFVLDKTQPQRVAGVGLTLKKTSVKRYRFSLALVADDMEIEKKDRTVNEPIFFYLKGSKRFYELVVNKVESTKVTGYVSTPRGAVQSASRSEGAQ